MDTEMAWRKDGADERDVGAYGDPLVRAESENVRQLSE